MLLDRRGGVVVKLFFSLGFLAIVGGLFWMYHNLFVEVVEDFVVVESGLVLSTHGRDDIL